MASDTTRRGSPNEKLNVAVIGAGGHGAWNAERVSGENIHTICDTDESNFAALVEKLPQVASAKRETDWRRVLDDDAVDAVVVVTADHHHALISVAAMQRGMSVYCEKPLAHNVREARRMREVYGECAGKVATQMGTQMHASDNYRRIVETIRAGAIGPVSEAHVWCSRTIPPLEPLAGEHEVPGNLAWDTWLGPADARPYNPGWQPGNLNWNRRWEFGNGVLGDMGSHLIDLPWWALDLKEPLTAASEGPPADPIKLPEWQICTWTHAPRTSNPNLNVPLTLKWYHGGSEWAYRPEVDTGVDLTEWFNGILFVGAEGMLLADYEKLVLLPEEKYADYTPPPETIPPSLGHHEEWIAGAKMGSETLCNFEYSGSLVEHNLLGNVAHRVGRELQWDPVALKATNCPEADAYIGREYREGWGI